MHPGTHNNSASQLATVQLPTLSPSLATSVRKVGAEILLEVERAIQNLLIDRPPHPSDLNRHVLKLHLLMYENQNAPAAVSDLLSTLFENAECWAADLKIPERSSVLIDKTLRYLEKNWDTFTMLSQLCSPSDTLAAKKLGLSLVEFDSEISGKPLSGYNVESRHQTSESTPSFSVLTDVVKLEQALTIDQSLHQPQSGFAFAEPVQELLLHLSRRQSHLFVAYQHSTLIGFYLPVFNPESVQSFLPESTFEQLSHQGFLTSADRPGWVEIVGTAPHNRLTLAKAGVHLYDLFDRVVTDSARKEGANVLLGVVREGPQANLSIKSHLRKGWQKTGIISLGHDGKTPYHVLSRRLLPAESVAGFEHTAIATASHFELNDCSLSLKDESVEHAESISNGEALSRCRDYFSHIYPQPGIIEWQGYHEFSIQVKEGNGGIHYFLRQARPHTDIWKYNSPFGNDSAGSLAEVLPAVASDLGYPTNPDY